MSQASYYPEEDAAFERLAELLDLLPTIEAQAARLAEARAAQAVAELEDKAAVLQREYDQYQIIYKTALADAALAREAGDKRAEDNAMGTARAYAELIAVRVAPLRRAQQAYETALETLELTDDVSLDTLLLNADERAELVQHIEEYQQEYQQLYEACKIYEH